MYAAILIIGMYYDNYPVKLSHWIICNNWYVCSV